MSNLELALALLAEGEPIPLDLAFALMAEGISPTELEERHGA